MNKWNKVDECLPSIGAPVRVSSITSGVTDGMFVHEDRKHSFLKWIVNGALCFDVTHWQAKDYPKSPSADCKEDKREKCDGCIRFYCDTDGGIPHCHGLLALEGKCRLGGIFPEMAKGKGPKCSGPFRIGTFQGCDYIGHISYDEKFSPAALSVESIAEQFKDWLNEIWKERKEKEPQESSGGFFYTTPLSSGKYIVVMLEPRQKPRALSPFPVDKSVADDVASALNQLWAKAFGK